MSYRNISDFAGNINNVSNDPLTYCVPDFLNSQFLHGADGRIFGKYNRQCGIFMANRCSQKWDGICEAMSMDEDTNYPDMTDNVDGACRLSAGDILIKNTAYAKYLLQANGCNVLCEPFNPNAADSPTICYLSETSCSIGDGRATKCGVLKGDEVRPEKTCPADRACFKEYGLTLEQIQTLDDDPVMNKLIDKPCIAPILLNMILENIKKRGLENYIRPKRLGKFYEINGVSL